MLHSWSLFSFFFRFFSFVFMLLFVQTFRRVHLWTSGEEETDVGFGEEDGLGGFSTSTSCSLSTFISSSLIWVSNSGCCSETKARQDKKYDNFNHLVGIKNTKENQRLFLTRVEFKPTTLGVTGPPLYQLRGVCGLLTLMALCLISYSTNACWIWAYRWPIMCEAPRLKGAIHNGEYIRVKG